MMTVTENFLFIIRITKIGKFGNFSKPHQYPFLMLSSLLFKHKVRKGVHKGRQEENQNIIPSSFIRKGRSLPVLLWGLVFVLLPQIAEAQKLVVNDPYLQIAASANDPLYTTYAASMDRSRLYGDKAYKMVYYADCDPLYYSTDQGGRILNVWMINKLVVDKVEKYHKKPVVSASFPDMALLEYEPIEDVRVQECFFVYSSTLAICQLSIENTSGKEQLIELFPVLELGKNSLHIQQFDKNNNGYITHLFETKERLISNLYKNAPYPTFCRDFFGGSEAPYSFGGFTGNPDDFYNYIKTDFYEENRIQDSLNFKESGPVDFVSLHYQFKLKPGESKSLQYFRGLQDQSEDPEEVIHQINEMKHHSLQPFVDSNVALFNR